MPPPYCVGKMHENGRKRATCGTTASGIHLRGRSVGPGRSRPRSRASRRACTMAFGLHERGRIGPSRGPVCALGPDPRACHQQHNGLSVTPIRFRLSGATMRRQVAGGATASHRRTVAREGNPCEPAHCSLRRIEDVRFALLPCQAARKPDLSNRLRVTRGPVSLSAGSYLSAVPSMGIAITAWSGTFVSTRTSPRTGPRRRPASGVLMAIKTDPQY